MSERTLSESKEIQERVLFNLKKAFSQIDPKNKGQVKREDFIKMLKVLDVTLMPKEMVDLCRRFDNNGCVDYKKAVEEIILNEDTGQWELRRQRSVSTRQSLNRNALRNLNTMQTMETGATLDLKPEKADS